MNVDMPSKKMAPASLKNRVGNFMVIRLDFNDFSIYYMDNKYTKKPLHT